MQYIRVRNKDHILGIVDIESWVNPRTHTLDFIAINDSSDANGEKVYEGDFWPEEKNGLEFITMTNF